MVKQNITIIILLMISIYLLFSFAALNINFIEWSPRQRSDFAFILGSIIGISSLIYILEINKTNK